MTTTAKVADVPNQSGPIDHELRAAVRATMHRI
jgi:hypothetical protein